MKNSKCYPLLLLLVLALPACISNPNCYESKQVLVYCGLYSSENGRAGSIENVSVKGLGSDSMIYDNKTLAQLALPLRHDAQESVFIIEILQSSLLFRDSLRFLHTNNEWFISMECGCVVQHSLLDVQTGRAGFIDSVRIVNSDIQNIETEHVKIYM